MAAVEPFLRAVLGYIEQFALLHDGVRFLLSSGISKHNARRVANELHMTGAARPPIVAIMSHGGQTFGVGQFVLWLEHPWKQGCGMGRHREHPNAASCSQQKLSHVSYL
jgi:hypothetical protein